MTSPPHLADCSTYQALLPLCASQSTLSSTELNLRTLLSKKKMVVPVANYIQATGWFKEGGDGQRDEEQHQIQGETGETQRRRADTEDGG